MVRTKIKPELAAIVHCCHENSAGEHFHDAFGRNFRPIAQLIRHKVKITVEMIWLRFAQLNTRYQWDGCHWQLRVFGLVGLDSNSHLCGKVLIAGGQVFFVIPK